MAAVPLQDRLGRGHQFGVTRGQKRHHPAQFDKAFSRRHRRMLLHRLVEEPGLKRIGPGLGRPVRQVGGKARDAIVDPQEHRRPGQCQHRMPCRNPGRAFARHQRLAAPDRKHRPRREGFCQTRIIAPQTCASVKRRATEGYCFCDLHAGLTFDRLFA
jgi:hypothetical protein